MMGFWEVFLIAVGLSMDAFAVSVCKGLATPKCRVRNSLICGVWFGGFQILMPLIGCFLGTRFADYMESVDHWIAFVLLALIGSNMIREAIRGDEEENVDSSYSAAQMFPLAVATAIDALAVGVTFAFLHTDIWLAVLEIGMTTFVISAVGVKIGVIFGERYASKAEITGGGILIFIGARILCQHLGVLV